MPHRHERTIARRTAVQVLFAWEMRVSAAKEKDKAKITPHTLLESGELEVIEGPIDEYTLKLIDGVVDNKEKIDGILEHMSRNWSDLLCFGGFGVKRNMFLNGVNRFFKAVEFDRF